ncbi:DUF4853 domain-containing protein [Buchananella hordeovulneris]|uniref:DUF4853 domain-containing protein n=1 Tax=Buchananella hordeovulneris TaxID=52770 RepID=UPI0026DBE750|nr:DUF4853 domain-containing protein [Buchananella hordeovulneris]
MSIALVVVTVLGGCGVNGPKNNDPRYGDGALPVEERQSLEEFVSETEPRIVEFMQAMDAAGAKMYLPGSSESSLRSCGYPVYGYQLHGPFLFGSAVPEEVLLRLYEEYVQPLGFDHVIQRSGEVNTSYEWFNRRDGGYVKVTLFPDGGLVASFASGCRPYRGEGKPEHVRTAWEQELISRQPPTPDPSESPTPSEAETAGR